MPKILLLSISIIVFIFSSCSTLKKSPQKYFNGKIKIEETTRIISTLANDKLNGRKPGTEGYEIAANYAANELKSVGIKPFFKGGMLDTVEHNNRISYNVVGIINSKKESKGYILLGAHLDHLGTTNESTDTIFNGANDDASGVTAAIQIAKALSKVKLNKNVIVALFTEEESGLNGSKSLAQKLKSQGINLRYVVNFEMLGTELTNGPGQTYITGYKLSDFADLLNKSFDSEFATFLPTAEQYRLFYRSDNFAFFEAFNIPSHTLSTFDFTNYDYYHKVEDEVEALDLNNMNLVIQKAALGIYKMILDNDVPTMK